MTLSLGLSCMYCGEKHMYDCPQKPVKCPDCKRNNSMFEICKCKAPINPVKRYGLVLTIKENV